MLARCCFNSIMVNTPLFLKGYIVQNPPINVIVGFKLINAPYIIIIELKD